MTRLGALLSAAFLAGCASGPEVAGRPVVPPDRWTGQLNIRGGQPHEGTFHLALSSSPGGLTGEYLMEADRCLPSGEVGGERRGPEVRAVVTRGESRMEIHAALEGEALYGKYTFTGGPCRGDWGSLVGKRAK